VREDHGADSGPATPVDVRRTRPPRRHRLRELHDRLHANPVTGMITKVVVTIVGAAVVLTGIVLSGPGVPGPGFLVILLGFAILSTEWQWAERLLHWLREKGHRFMDRARAMDPAVRRRRMVLTGVGIVSAVVAISAYVWVNDWPSWAVGGWSWVQGVAGFVPDLPGM
jgi:uncharacterized protein (TIGR02611 family)